MTQHSRPHRVVVRAPTRIDFGGGWTDVPPYSDEEGGFVCNVAIARYATVAVAARPDSDIHIVVERSADRSLVEAATRRLGVRGIDIKLSNDFPVGAGLGGSSAAGVATLSALASYSGARLQEHALAELSRDVEIADLGIAGGRQDHYAAVYGGLLGLSFSAHPVVVRRIPMPPSLRSQIESRCTVVYTGQSRISGDTITAVLGAYRDGNLRVRHALARTRELAAEMAVALDAADVDALAELVKEQWSHQRALHPAIPTPRIDDIIARAYESGAAGAKALGASGGGCVLAVARRGRDDEVRAAVSGLGELLPFTIDEQGVSQCP